MEHRRLKIAGTEGVLIIEALVSFALFLVASIALYGLMGNARKAEATARLSVAANAYARQLMESQRVLGYSGLTVGTKTGTKDYTISRDGKAGVTRMTHTITVYEGPGTGVRSVVVLVGWRTNINVTLETYVTQ